MKLEGSFVAIVTPMHPDGSLALDALERLVDAHVAAGTDGIVVAGTTGESAALDRDEHAEVVAAVVARVAGRCPVIAGAGSPATRFATDLARRAEDAGADALLCVTPYYLRTTQAGLEAHFRAIADAVGLPVVLYNVPGRTGVDLAPATAGRLADVASIVAIKEAVAGAERVRELRAATGDRLSVLSGDDKSCFEALEAGARGVISVTANLAPGAMARMCRSAREGRWEEAAAIDGQLRELHALLMAEPNPIPVKRALANRGLIPAGLRLPLVPASEDLARRLEAVLEALGPAVVHG